MWSKPPLHEALYERPLRVALPFRSLKHTVDSPLPCPGNDNRS